MVSNSFIVDNAPIWVVHFLVMLSVGNKPSCFFHPSLGSNPQISREDKEKKQQRKGK